MLDQKSTLESIMKLLGLGKKEAQEPEDLSNLVPDISDATAPVQQLMTREESEQLLAELQAARGSCGCGW